MAAFRPLASVGRALLKVRQMDCQPALPDQALALTRCAQRLARAITPLKGDRSRRSFSCNTPARVEMNFSRLHNSLYFNVMRLARYSRIPRQRVGKKNGRRLRLHGRSQPVDGQFFQKARDSRAGNLYRRAEP